MYTITLENGHKLENLELNGNNYIAGEVVEDSVFVGNLDTVTISDGKTETTCHDVVLLSNIVRDGKSWIVLGQKTEQQKREETLMEEITDLKKKLSAALEELAAAKIVLGVE